MYKLLKDKPSVAIVVLNWNGWNDTVKCLKSITRIDYANYNIIIVDNGSTDGSAEKIIGFITSNAQLIFGGYRKESRAQVIEHSEGRTHLSSSVAAIRETDLEPSFVTIIKNEKNVGFAKGNNIGVELAVERGADYVLLLNNDTVVDPHFLTELVNVAETDAHIGFCGPLIYDENFHGERDVISFAGGFLDRSTGSVTRPHENQVDTGQIMRTVLVDYIEGCCLLTKVSMIKQIGLMDPIYFAYWEDIDWCIRGQESGFVSVFVPRAKIWHAVSSSNVGKMNTYYMIRNRFWFMKRHFTCTQYVRAVSRFFLYDFWAYGGSFLLFHRSSLPMFARAVLEGLASGTS